MTAAFEQLARAAMPGPPLDEPAGGLPDDRELQLLLGLQDLLNARFETSLPGPLGSHTPRFCAADSLGWGYSGYSFG